MRSLQDDHRLNGEEEKVAEAVKDISTHLITVDEYDDQLKVDDTKNCLNTDSRSHLATIEDQVPTIFTAHLHEVAFFMRQLPRYQNNDLEISLEGFFVDTEAKRAWRARAVQYAAYCNFLGQTSSIDVFQAAVCHSRIESASLLGMASISFLVVNL